MSPPSKTQCKKMFYGGWFAVWFIEFVEVVADQFSVAMKIGCRQPLIYLNVPDKVMARVNVKGETIG